MKANFRRIVRKSIKALDPRLVQLYRSWKDATVLSQTATYTPFGFKLVGPSSVVDGKFEQAEIKLFLDHLQECEVCVDIGANVGLYSCLAACKGKRVIAIEPLVSNYQLLLRNLSDNGFLSTEVHLMALSAEVGLKRMYGGWDRRLVGQQLGRSYGDSATLVPSTTLDALLARRFEGLPTIIKMDVEGHEYEVLRGAGAILARTPGPMWLVEVSFTEHWPNGRNPKFRETFEIFWRNGYSAVTADEKCQLVSVQDVDRWIETGNRNFGSHNYLFKRNV